MAINNTLILGNTSDEVRGRVMSIYMMTVALMPLGVLPMGAIAEKLGVYLAVGGGGAVVALFTIAMAILLPRLRRLE